MGSRREISFRGILTPALFLREREDFTTVECWSLIGGDVAALRLTLPLLGERAGVRKDVASLLNRDG
jgi:hypothetical protein